ncbi:MAG: BspA family leucine-rich repeat surface protein, partial [Cyclobacteriaceae bacterium]
MVIRPLFKLAFFAIIIGCTFFGSTSVTAQTVAAADLGTSNVTIYKTSKQLVYGFGISATGGDATLTALTTQATGGTYSASDIVNFELYFNNTANDFRSATLVGTSGPSTGTGEGINFGSFSQVITGDGTDRYFYIAINVAAGATSGNTFSIPFLDATNFTFSALVTFTPALGPSGTKTIQDQTPFITTWKTDNPGTSNDNQITIPTTGTGYLYDVNWGDGMTDTDVTGDITHTYAAPGTYTVSITGAFPRIYFNAASFFSNKDSHKLLTVEQWGDVAWSSMSKAFSGCENLTINAIDAPDLSDVTDMSEMFYEALVLNTNINNWDVSNVTNMAEIFQEAEAFNQPLDLWVVDNVTNMSSMFERAPLFNQDLNSWNVDNVTSMFSMFNGASAFNGNVSSWKVDKVTSFRFMFLNATSFNQDISTWQLNAVGNVNLSGMFSGAIVFNQDISFKPGGGNNGGDAWNTNTVTDMSLLFRQAIAFTQPITNWAVNVGNVTNMREMFGGNTTFNQDISSWNVGKVLDMENMFESATSFNQDISGWNVTLVNDMSEMFSNATAFNQDLGRVGGWDVSGVSDMRLMFENATSFDQDLSGWDVTNLNLAVSMFNNSGLSVSNYDKLLEGWAALPVRSNVSFGAQGIYYCSAQAARDVLTTTFNWNITDGGPKCITLFDGPDTTAPEIINGQAQAIDFGSTSTSKSRTFTLLNNQDIPITNVQINNASPGFPSVVVFVSIAAGATQSFTIDLTGPIGTYTETVSITSDDFSGSFQFDVTGEVTAAPEPEIAV